jgi:putative MATE family efflux protein
VKAMSRDDNKRYLILKDKSVFKGLIILAIPIMFNNFVKTIHDIVDMFFVSKINGYGTDAVSSISITFPVFFMFISLGIGLGVAGTSIISQYLGSAQEKEAKKFATNLVVLSLFIGLFLNVIAYLGAPFIMKVMGADGFTLENSVKYLQIRSFELPVLFLFFAYTAIRQASGDTITPMFIGVITVFLNIVLSPFLILGYGLGVPGAAYATLASYLIVLPIILYKLRKDTSGIVLDFEFIKPNKYVVNDLVRTAIPSSLGQSFTAVGFIVLTSFILSYGDDTVAAFSVSNRISSLILHPAMALGAVLSAYVGQNIGNLNVPRAKEAFRKAMILGVVIMATGSAIVINYRRNLAEIFIDDNQFALDLANDYLFFLLLGLPLMAIFQTFIGVYNGSGNTKYTFVIGVVRLWLLRIPLILIFKYFTDLGASGIWYAMLLSNLLIVILGTFLYKKVDYKPKIRIG